jgi:hypothetical protein
MNEALKRSLHVISEVVMASETYRVSITEHKMGLARHHKAFERYLATNFIVYRYKLTVCHQGVEPQPQNHIQMKARLR